MINNNRVLTLKSFLALALRQGSRVLIWVLCSRSTCYPPSSQPPPTAIPSSPTSHIYRLVIWVDTTLQISRTSVNPISTNKKKRILGTSDDI